MFCWGEGATPSPPHPYFSILIANLGGYVDVIMKNEIRDNVNQVFAANPASRNMDPEVRKKLIAETIALQEKRLGLDTPVAIRTFNYLVDGLTLNLGRALNMTSDNGSKTVRLILLERLPATLLLMGTSQLFLFFSSVYLALSLSRHYGGFFDKRLISPSSSSAPPPQCYWSFLYIPFASPFY